MANINSQGSTKNSRGLINALVSRRGGGGEGQNGLDQTSIIGKGYVDKVDTYIYRSRQCKLVIHISYLCTISSYRLFYNIFTGF